MQFLIKFDDIPNVAYGPYDSPESAHEVLVTNFPVGEIPEYTLLPLENSFPPSMLEKDVDPSPSIG